MLGFFVVFCFQVSNVKHTFSHHSDDKALLEAAELAAVSSAFVNRTVFIR